MLNMEFSSLFSPSVCDTYTQMKGVSAVLVPWRVFHKAPNSIHRAFRYDHGQIVYDNDVNVMMDAPMLQSSDCGCLDDFTQTWEIGVKSEEELDSLLIKLTSFTTVLSATLTQRNVFGENSEISTVVFLDPSSPCIEQLTRNLGQCRKTFRGGKRFSVEVDLGPSVEQWSRMVLRKDFLCLGARFCITSGSKFNHLWDWTNILGCLPCFLCGLVGTSIYRTNRKLKYIDINSLEVENIVITGTISEKAASQRSAIYSLMKWINSVPSPICENCKHSFSKDSSDKQCSEYHVTFQEQQFNDVTLALLAQRDNGKMRSDKERTGETSAGNSRILSLTVTTDGNKKTDEEKEAEKAAEKEIEKEAANARKNRMFLFPYYDETDKYYEKYKNNPLSVEENFHFVKSSKMLRSRHFVNAKDKNSLLDALRDSPYNETNTTSIKRMNEEQLQELQISVMKNEEELQQKGQSFVLPGSKTFTQRPDEPKPRASIKIEETRPESITINSKLKPIKISPTGSDNISKDTEIIEDYPQLLLQSETGNTSEFSQRAISASRHAFMLPRDPSETFFREYDPLTHMDVLNFLACKNAKEPQSDVRKNKPGKRRPRK